jgi:hypothetical protein
MQLRHPMPLLPQKPNPDWHVQLRQGGLRLRFFRHSCAARERRKQADLHATPTVCEKVITAAGSCRHRRVRERPHLAMERRDAREPCTGTLTDDVAPIRARSSSTSPATPRARGTARRSRDDRPGGQQRSDGQGAGPLPPAARSPGLPQAGHRSGALPRAPRRPAKARSSPVQPRPGCTIRSPEPSDRPSPPAALAVPARWR